MRTHQVADLIITILGVLMTIIYTIVMYHQATLDPYSVWCDPHAAACVTPH